MIRSAKIAGYRALKEFNLEGTGQVNLLVGRNNSGKTSVLEALYLLSTGGDPISLWNILQRRGEFMPFETIPGRPVQQEVDVTHLFHDHVILEGSNFSVKTTNSESDEFTCRVVKAESQDTLNMFAGLQGDFPKTGTLALSFEGPRAKLVPTIPLIRGQGFRQDALQIAMNVANANRAAFTHKRAQFVSTGSLTVAELINTWSSIVLTTEEDRVVSALQSLDPTIERIAAVPPTIQFFQPTRGGFAVKVRGAAKPIPIGSFGDGMWRLLSLAISIGQAKDGILLVDEIDTGLHHSAMRDMWRLILGAAKELNVQVFATTHSYDCVRSLASVTIELSFDQEEVTIQRVEYEKSKSISYNAEQIKIAAEQYLEVR